MLEKSIYNLEKDKIINKIKKQNINNTKNRLRLRITVIVKKVKEKKNLCKSDP